MIIECGKFALYRVYDALDLRQPSNLMIKVNWPLITRNRVDDDIVCDWLEHLVNLNKEKAVFELSKDYDAIYFYNEDDAVAFRLKFGL